MGEPPTSRQRAFVDHYGPPTLLGERRGDSHLPWLELAIDQPEHVLRVDMDPRADRSLPVPAGIAFVLAYSGEEPPGEPELKASRDERVIGARLAAALLANEVGLDVGNPPRLRDVADVDVVDLLADGLPDRASVREVARAVEVEPGRLARLDPGAFDQMAKVHVRRYARHLLGEARRVDEAEAALRAGDLARFGATLNASHESLRGDYRVSTAALDRLCAAMRRGGALGARLIGPVFGGHAVAAVPLERLAEVLAAAEAASGGPAFEARPAGT